MANSEYGLNRISQSALLVYDKKVLLLLHKSGKWLLPGGRLEVGENWLKGLRREIKEETGIDNIETVRILEVDNWNYDNENYYGAFFLAISPIDRIRLSDEHIEFAWVSKDEVQNYEFWNNDLKNRVVRLAQKIL